MRRGTYLGMLSGDFRPIRSQSIVESIKKVAFARPHHHALTYGRETRTYEQLWARAGAIAATLTQAGLGPGARLVLWGDRTPDVVCAALGTMAVGAAYIPVDPGWPAGRLQGIVDLAGPVAVAHDSRAATPRPPRLGVAQVDLAAAGEIGAWSLPPPPQSTDTAYVMFTSGSTGHPKGVLIDHGALLNYSAWCAHTVGRSGSGTILFGSLGYDVSVTSLWPTLIAGKTVDLSPGIWEAEAIFRHDGVPYSYVKMTPSQVKFIERFLSPIYHEATNLLMFGAESLDPGLVRSISDRIVGTRLMNHYGPTETTVGCCFYEFDREHIPSLPTVPIGRPIWNTRAYVLDERDLSPVGSGDEGELVIAGAGISRGYIGKVVPEGRFIDESSIGGQAGPAYRTGDLVELLPDGTLLFLGRRDGQHKFQGHRIEMGELRFHALRVEGVTDAAFEIVVDDFERLEAFITTSTPSNSREIVDKIRLAMSAALPPAVVPSRVHVVPEIRMNANGKTDLAATRRQLQEPRVGTL